MSTAEIKPLCSDNEKGEKKVVDGLFSESALREWIKELINYS